MTTYTRNLGLAKPVFDTSTWHDDVNSNMDIIDASLSSIGIYLNLRGIWENATAYEVEDRVVDPVQNNVWRAIEAHTSPVSGTFLDAFLANPNRWALVAPGIVPRGLWAPETLYVQNDIVFDIGEGVSAICTLQHTSSNTGSIRADLDAGLWLALADLGPAMQTVADYTQQTQTMYDEIVEMEQTVIAGEAIVVAALSAYPVGGASGQALIKQSAADYDATWATLPGGGDMLQSVYDPEALGQNLAMPAGAIVPFAGSTIPATWSLCDGGALSRTTEARLFAAIGTTYGAGNGTTTFNKPDLRSRFIRGHADSYGTLGQTFGDTLKSHDHTVSVDSGGQHGHTGTAASAGSHTHTGSAANAGGHTHTGTAASAGAHTHTVSGTAASAGAHTHNVTFVTATGSTSNRLTGTTSGPANNATSSAAAASAGAHTHSVSGTAASAGAHTHSLTINAVSNHTHTLTINSAGAHTHTITVDSGGAHTHTATATATGDAETAPRHMLLHYIIKL